MKGDTGMTHTWDALKAFGFRPDAGVVSDIRPGLCFDLGDLTLAASAVVGRHFNEVVLFTGALMTSRRMAEIEFEMPRQVESGEQCAAWLAWNLDKYHVADSGQRTTPEWLSLGRNHQHLLPWVAEAAAYSARPQCSMDRDLARVVLKKLRAALAAVPPDTEVCFSFDGDVLKIRFGQELIAASASGERWKHHYRIEAGKLAKVPARLMQPFVTISCWQTSLRIANRLYSGVIESVE